MTEVASNTPSDTLVAATVSTMPLFHLSLCLQCLKEGLGMGQECVDGMDGMGGMDGMDGMAWWHGGMVAYLHEGKQTLVFESFRTGQEVFFSFPFPN